MRTSRFTTTARAGFTLVELMVAAALIILILSIISVAFHAGIDSFRTLKSVGDMSEGLRTVDAIIRRDMSAEHLVDESGNPIRVSHSRFGIPSNPTLYPGVNWHPDSASGGAPGRRGYFVIRQPSQPMQTFNPALPAPQFLPMVTPWDNTTDRENYPYLYEGTEDGVPSYRATDHTIAFTVRLDGTTAQEVFYSSAPNGTPPYPGATPPFTDMTRAPLSLERFSDRSNPQFVSRWAEVAYFLRPTSVLTSGEDGTTELRVYTLYRRHRALAPSPVAIQPPAPVNPTYPFNEPQNANYYRERYPDLSIATVTDPAATTAIVNTPESVNRPLLVGSQTYFPGRLDTIVDWRNSGVGPPPVPMIRMIPAGVAETAPAASFDGTIANAERYGADVLLNNVLSFHVQVLTDASVAAGPPYWTDPGAGAWPRVYDTASSTARVLAVRISVRVYDTKMKLTRQLTIVQDL